MIAGVVDRVALAALLLALLGVSGCGDDTPALPTGTVPPWASVAPEQIAEAKKHGLPVAFENDIGMRFVLIPAGTFVMGRPESEGRIGSISEREHRVTISSPFYLQVCEVTVGQFMAFEPKFPRTRAPGRRGGEEHQPVEVRWEDADNFAKWLSSQDAHAEYRLPTEAQWELACRAGSSTRFSFGETISYKQANFDDRPWNERSRVLDSSDGPRGEKVRVGSYRSNAWGLHDMHGNVGEWCSDWYSNHLPAEHVVDPRGPTTPEVADIDGQPCRSHRGGGWRDRSFDLRSGRRQGRGPYRIDGSVGFRLISPLPEPKDGK